MTLLVMNTKADEPPRMVLTSVKVRDLENVREVFEKLDVAIAEIGGRMCRNTEKSVFPVVTRGRRR